MLVKLHGKGWLCYNLFGYTDRRYVRPERVGCCPLFPFVDENWIISDKDQGGNKLSRNVVEAVEKLALPILEEEGLELYDTEFTKEGKDWFLRVYIERPEGKVDLDDCGRISERLSKELDRTELITRSYYLDVSSPGVERPLKKGKHFEQAVGKRIFLKTYEAVEGRKKFEGELLRYTPENLTVDVDGVQVEIPMDKVAKARRVLMF